MPRSIGIRTSAVRALATALILVGALGAAAPASGATYRNPTMATDFPDPTVLRVGNEYWATATNHGSAQPVFQLARSPDLVNWSLVGSVFPTAPRWATRSWWAPSLVGWRGHFLLYYSATPRGASGRCIAVAVADRIAGPWADRGPLVCGDNPIDPTTTTDPSGQQLLLVWAAPGGMFVQPLTAEGTGLAGSPTNVMKVDQPWEKGVAENPSMVRHNGFYELIYSGGVCCGFTCAYGVGVARALTPLGPFRKYDANPILAGNGAWRCPGGNEVVADASGNPWLAYHAYSPISFGFAGRQMLLDRIDWRDDWPVINGGGGPSAVATAPFGGQRSAAVQSDDFSGRSLGPHWQWEEDARPGIRVRGGQLAMTPTRTLTGRARLTFARAPSASYTAETALTKGDGGVAALWGPFTGVGIERLAGKVRAWAVPTLSRSEFTIKRVTAPRGSTLRVRLSARFNRFTLSYSSNGRRWRRLVGYTAQLVDTWVYGTSVVLTTRHGGSFDYMRLTTNG
jgi:xylan 1,4-beta-xylosidase